MSTTGHSRDLVSSLKQNLDIDQINLKPFVTRKKMKIPLRWLASGTFVNDLVQQERIGQYTE